MNMLIVGGLLALAVIAIVGAVLLGIGEERAEKQRKEQEASAAPLIQASSAAQEQQASDAAPPPTMLPSTTPGTLASGYLRTTRQLAPSLHEDEQLLAQKNGQWSVPVEEESLTLLNKQIHAITGELRSLAQKASEMEQRLSMLSELLESQQHAQSDATVNPPIFRKIEISSF